ncbi:hypothetical protein [Brevibacillus laterosporus]|uniref:hypothetical protein n=1 Tax=Brevibacillus laterosporus TaxID=1465 RepID=UPI0003B1E7BC|nr:hypothetical protein [Brevibacillus laterosporus]ERM16647.1 hypothetical protein P615_22625 [Brevibacillus laterosporus PE36]
MKKKKLIASILAVASSNKSEPVDPLNYVEPLRNLDVRSTVDEESFVPNPYNERYSEETSDQ